jgi:hypothetical protein
MNEQIHQDDTQIDIESGYLATLRFLSNLTTNLMNIQWIA